MDELSSLGEGGSKHLARDLRVYGLIVLFLAPGVALLGWFIGQESAQWLLPIVGVAALVGCLSIGLLVASTALERRHQRDDAAARDQPKA